nr:MAG TPA: hypothetical protein [Caudoviricetes sp.]
MMRGDYFFLLFLRDNLHRRVFSLTWCYNQ